MWAPTTTLQLKRPLWTNKQGNTVGTDPPSRCGLLPRLLSSTTSTPYKTSNSHKQLGEEPPERMHHFQNPYQTAFTELSLFQRWSKRGLKRPSIVSTKTYTRKRNSVTSSDKIQHLEALYKQTISHDWCRDSVFIFKRKIIYHLDN